MRRYLFPVVLLVLGMLFSLAFTFAPFMQELTEAQLVLLALVAVPVIGEGVRLIYVPIFKKVPTKAVMTLLLGIVSIGLAMGFDPAALRTLPPATPNILAFLAAAAALIGSYIGIAKLAYDFLWDKVFDYLAKKGIGVLDYRNEP